MPMRLLDCRGLCSAKAETLVPGQLSVQEVVPGGAKRQTPRSGDTSDTKIQGRCRRGSLDSWKIFPLVAKCTSPGRSFRSRQTLETHKTDPFA